MSITRPRFFHGQGNKCLGLKVAAARIFPFPFPFAILWWTAFFLFLAGFLGVSVGTDVPG